MDCFFLFWAILTLNPHTLHVFSEPPKAYPSRHALTSTHHNEVLLGLLLLRAFRWVCSRHGYRTVPSFNLTPNPIQSFLTN